MDPHCEDEEDRREIPEHPIWELHRRHQKALNAGARTVWLYLEFHTPPNLRFSSTTPEEIATFLHRSPRRVLGALQELYQSGLIAFVADQPPQIQLLWRTHDFTAQAVNHQRELER